MRAANATHPYITYHDAQGTLTRIIPLYPPDDTPLPLGTWVLDHLHLDPIPEFVCPYVERALQSSSIYPHHITLTYLAS